RRQHQLAELGQVGERALAPKQVAAELFLQIANRTAQRGLRDVALVGSLGEIEQSRRRQKIADLVHFHAWSLVPSWSPTARPSFAGRILVRTPIHSSYRNPSLSVFHRAAGGAY